MIPPGRPIRHRRVTPDSWPGLAFGKCSPYHGVLLTARSLTHSMHELSLTQSLVAIAEEHARQAGGTVIRSITVEVGELAGAIPEALEFAFDVCSKGTLADGAVLILRRIPGHGHCAACATEADCHELIAVCPQCGSLAFELDAGRELRVVELEID